MTIRSPLYKALTILVVVGLLFGTLSPVVHAQDGSTLHLPVIAGGTAPIQSDGILFRTQVTVNGAAQWRKLESIGVVILDRGDKWAIVIVDDDQLQTLARLRYNPDQTNEIAALIVANAASNRQAADSLQPLLTQMALAKQSAALDTANIAQARTDLRAAMMTLAAQEQVFLAQADDVDTDLDGLTNTEEEWWCTDPSHPNSDRDAQGYKDGVEVDALLDFTLPRNVRWNYGAPFGPPNAWPDFNNRDGNPNTPACNDGDFDTIPDFAEAFVVGSRVPEESTDHDKFEDGQELFGVTYCPGAPTNCGYGNYPAIEYWNFIKATMPSWVRPPGDNPFVAAFPVPEVSVLEGSWKVERVTTITTSQGQMTQQAHTYGSSALQGQGSSIADTRNWNEWEEVSQAIETPFTQSREQDVTASSVQVDWGQTILGGSLIAGGSVAGAVGAAAVGGTVGSAIIGGLGLTACVASVVCGVALVAGGAIALGVGGILLENGLSDDSDKDPLQITNDVSVYNNNTNLNNVSASANAQANIVLNQNLDLQGVANSLDGVQYAINQQGQLIANSLHDISYAISQPRFTETRSNGKSWGGAQTTTHEVYEEHTLSESESFTTGENWETAWAVDSSHAADLTFTFLVKNIGTEYARELTNVIFGIYLGDDPTPIISYPAWQQFANGKLENIFPGNANTFTSTPIPLSLEQMKRIDLGERLTVVLEDFSYGADELFYEDAVNGSLTVFIEDGVDDGDELVDRYVIPTWQPESVQEVLTRFFPAGYDGEDNLNSLWTPEFDGTNSPTWHEHYLSDTSWWNIYLSQPDAGNIQLKDLSADPGASMLFRFNRDSDRDGYNDRAEMHYGTDKNDPASHPQPELLAGYVASRVGNDVTVELVLENSGSFDAYGIDAMMYAPDNTVTINNNTVGGNGRVRPGVHVAVGSLVQSPVLTGWGSSTAKPYAAGNYTGNADKVYAFSTSTPGAVGQGSTALQWTDGAGHSGSVDVGSNYHAPLPLDIAEGIQIGVNSGNIQAGASFTIKVLTPRDTFSYTVNSEPFSPPVIVVSYSDPQGSHRFVTPIELQELDDTLSPYAGEMLKDIELQVVTTEPVNASGSNTTNFVFNSPHEVPIESAHLYLNFVTNGTVVAEMPFTLDLQPGPTIYSVDWSVGSFSQPYDPDADNLLIAFWTDAQNNIIDSATRPLNSFAEDPTPVFVTDDAALNWNFGAVGQGALLQHQVGIANTGYSRLYTYLESTPGLELSIPNQTAGAADTPAYVLTLHTDQLPIGPYDQTLTLTTSDPEQSSRTIHLMGTIMSPTGDTEVGPVQWPLDVEVNITGPKVAGESVEYLHSLSPDPATLHPARVFNENRTVLLGVGKEATEFAGGTAPGDMFGTGADGDKTVSGEEIFDAPRTQLGLTVSAGNNTVILGDATAFNVGNELLIHQTQGNDAGRYEFHRISAKSGNQLTLDKPLSYTYTQNGNSKTQIIRVPNYQNVTITSTGRWRAPSWDGNTGGILVFRASSVIDVQSGGSIDGSGSGFRGGVGARPYPSQAYSGEGILGPSIPTYLPNGNGGGGGQGDDHSGGGGGNITPGGNASGGGNSGTSHAGQGGSAIDDSAIPRLVFGGGGGGGGEYGNDEVAPSGGNGGGIVIVLAREAYLNGSITVKGMNSGSRPPQGQALFGGGGAGGHVLVRTQKAVLGDNRINVLGGIGGGDNSNSGWRQGGDGGQGLIRVEYCESLNGTTYPSITPLKLSCYIAEGGAVASDLFGDGRDGVMPGSGNLDNANGFGIGNVNGTAASMSITVIDRQSVARINVGDVVVIHQTRGNGAGNWELNEAASDFTGSGTFTLQQPLKYSYVTNTGNERAQILRVPQYTDCPVTGTMTPLAGWNGDWGGIFAVICRGTMTVSGGVSLVNSGFRGGAGANSGNNQARAGEGETNTGGLSKAANGEGGGGGGWSPPNSTGGSAFQTDPTLVTRFVFGGGGGGGTPAPEYGNNNGATGGNGGGIALLMVKNIVVTGSIKVDGGAGTGSNGKSGGGGGGVIMIKTATASIGDALITANGGAGISNVQQGNGGGGGAGVTNGQGGGEQSQGGTGGVGSVRVEYCESLSGSTNPVASIQKLECYIAEQGETGTGHLSLPEDVADSATYVVQYARKLGFASAGVQDTALELPGTLLSLGQLDLLISGVGSGELTAQIDIGGDGTWDWASTQTVNDVVQFSASDLASAFNAYWVSQSSPTNAYTVPIRVGLSKAGKVLLTNLQVQAAPSVLRTVRVAPENYGTVTLDLLVGNQGNSSLAVAIDVGDNGTLDWRDQRVADFPVRLTTGNLATAFNSAVNGQGGLVDVPVRIYLAPNVGVNVDGITVSVNATTDLTTQGITVSGPTQVAAAGVTAGLAYSEGDVLPVQATLINSGNRGSGPVTAAFFATAPGWGDWYIGSDFVANIPAGGSVPVGIEWDTTGFVGTIPVKVVVNPYQRVSETNLTNNSSSATVTILQPPPLADFVGAPRTGEGSLTVHFTDTSTSTIPLAAWSWRFGDGEVSSQQHPTHIYNSTGSFTVTLTVTNTNGVADTDVAADYIIIDNYPIPPTANFTALPSGGAAPLTVHFTDTTSSPYPLTGWQWDFGDGQNSTEQHPTHEYQATGAYTATLTATNAYGSGSHSTQIVVQAGQVTVQVPLVAGWNLISIPVQPANPAPAQVFASIAGNYTVVWAFKGCDVADPWKKYSPTGAAFANDLQSIDVTQGLWIQMTSNATLSVVGVRPTSTSIPLCTGWNLVGYPSATSRTPGDAFAPIAGCYDIVWGYDAVDITDPWKKYDPDAPAFTNDLALLRPNYGYWILANQACSWIVPGQ